MKFSIIVTTDSDCGISHYKRVPWYFKEETQFFESTTANHVCIMGANTARNLRTPLPDRDNIVISSSIIDNFITVKTFDEALKEAKLLSGGCKEIFVIGGSQLINEALESPELDKIYYIHINKSVGCDNFINPILGRNMEYTILDRKVLDAIDTIHAVNMIGTVTLTFYLVRKIQVLSP